MTAATPTLSPPSTHSRCSAGSSRPLLGAIEGERSASWLSRAREGLTCEKCFVLARRAP
jgi:hypothetical protein